MIFIRPIIILAALAAITASAAEKPGSEKITVDEPTAAIIRAALKHLAAEQQQNGSWSEGKDRYTTAMTGYTLLAFMATGNLPGEGEYAKTVANAARYLTDSIQADGTYSPGRSGQYMYGHGIATIALAELYGQTRSPELRPKLEQVIKTILTSQNKEGGWRYQPRVGDADISVTVLQVVALRAAKNAGLDIPQEQIDRAVQYVHTCHDERTGGFTYQPRNRNPGFARTAAAIYSLQVCGRYNDDTVTSGANYLLDQTKTSKKRTHDYFTYGHFYAAPAMYMIGGPTWEKWYTNIKTILLENVERNGDRAYWTKALDPQSPGTLYNTAVYTTILAIPYHYLPLYQR